MGGGSGRRRATSRVSRTIEERPFEGMEQGVFLSNSHHQRKIFTKESTGAALDGSAMRGISYEVQESLRGLCNVYIQERGSNLHGAFVMPLRSTDFTH